MKLGTKINLVITAVVVAVLTGAFWIIIDVEGKNLRQQAINDAETVTNILRMDIERMFNQIHHRGVSLQETIDHLSKTPGVKYIDINNAENKYIATTDRSLIGQKITETDLAKIIEIKEKRKAIDVRKDKGSFYELERHIPIFIDAKNIQSSIINVIEIEVATRSKDEADVRDAEKLLQVITVSIERNTRDIIVTRNEDIAVLQQITDSITNFQFLHDFIIYSDQLEIIANTGGEAGEFADDLTEYQRLREDTLAGKFPVGEMDRTHEGKPIIMRILPIVSRDEKTGIAKNIGLIEIHILKESFETRLGELKFRMFGVGVVFTAILVVVLAIILERTVVGPIRRFSVIAQKVSNGDLHQKIEHISNDEIGQFGDVFNSMVANLREFDRLKSDFVSVAAHQLRTPLSGVKWVLKLLFDGDLGPTTDYQKRMLERGIEANEKMIQLVNDLLNVSRIENGKFGYKFEKNDFAKFLKTLVGNTDLPSKERNIEVRLDIKGDPIPEFHFDPEKLLIALQNIVDNALKYTLPGGSVTIAVERQGDYVEIKVTDTGVGIPKSDLPKLFSKFFRAANVIHLQTDGSGLGLFISKSVILRHGGQIWVDSVEGKGTTITTVIPLKEELLPKETEGEGGNGIWKA